VALAQHADVALGEQAPLEEAAVRRGDQADRQVDLADSHVFAQVARRVPAGADRDARRFLESRFISTGRK
jgi:hypothetical protein